MLTEPQFKIYPSPDGSWNASIFGLSPDDVGELLQTFNMVRDRQEDDDDTQMELFQ